MAKRTKGTIEAAAVLADSFIAAAQILERQAAELKRTAALVRRGELSTLYGSADAALANQRMHKESDCRSAGNRAAEAIGHTEADLKVIDAAIQATIKVIPA